MTQQSSKRTRTHVPSNWLQQLQFKVKKDGQKAGLSDLKIQQLLDNFEQSLRKTQQKDNS